MVEKPFPAHVLLRLIDEALDVARRDSRIVALGAFAERTRSCVPVGLEWVGGRPSG